jgi:hypothetical protein
MAEREGYELTDEWLERVNDDLRERDVPHKQRPWKAWREWSKYIGLPTSLGDENVQKIFDWFEKHTKAGSQYIDPMYVGSFYYDSCFWPVVIPVVAGRVRLDASKSLPSMPDTIKARLTRDRDAYLNYVAVWADCADYAFGIEEAIKANSVGAFGKELLKSGDQQLNATATLLHETTPNPKSMESARMATEMFLKAFLAGKGALTEKEAKDKIGHNLEKALDRCLAVDSQSELQGVRPDLNVFPEIGDRYKGTNKMPRELWLAYGTAQFVGTTVVRAFTGRDVRKTLRMG